MKKAMKKLWLALAAAVSWVGAAVAADIQYVADNGGGEYSGAGYGISVSVSAPATGAVVKYSESETGPWQDEPITYKDVCNAKPIYFQISATGYTTVTDSRTVTITPKTLTSDFVWLVLPTEDYVYDGTAKTPDAACGDGDPSIITPSDFDVSYSDNVNAGTAKATFTGKGNYTGTVEEEFEIQKAENEWTTEPAMAGWTYGQAASEPTSAAKVGTAAVTYGTSGNPGSLGDAKPTLPGSYVATFTVAESQNYKELTKDVDFTIAAATLQYVADDVSGEYNGTGYGIAATISVSAPATGAVVKYSESETGPWQDEPITYKDVCNAKPIYFQISATGYTTVTDSRTVTVTPKTLTSDFVWLVLPTEDYVYDGAEKTPEAACGDGDPSIITENDFDVSYSDNINAGTAKATFTGKNNYTGTVEEEFEIQRADNEWMTQPAMAGWTYGQAPSDPTSAAKVGTAVVTYGTAANPGSLGDAKPSLPGDYAATFTVAESQNYNELATNVEFTIAAATINYVADDVSGEYNGSGYGIATTISVSAPATGVVVKYAESETGPWQEEPITYRDVCAATPIYFQISAEGYSTVVDSRTVTVTPKTLTSDFVWLVLPTEDYVYDGTAKTPDAACGDGDPSIITPNDFDVSYSDNVDAGTAKATFTGKGNYTGTVEEEFEIQKADNEWTTAPAMAGWTYGQAASEPTSAAKDGVAAVTYGTAENPGSLGDAKPTLPGSYVATFTVPESQNYKELVEEVEFTIAAATVQYVADDVGGEYNGTGYGIAATISVSAPATGATIKYAESETGPWQEEPITYKYVCNAKPIYFQISATGYTTVTDSRTVTVTPKTLTSDFVWLVLPTEDYVYDGAAKTPDAACGDGDPSIITPNDFDVSYSDNVDAGTAKATFTGKGNYTGTVEEEFEILKADNEWTTEPAIAGWTYGQAASEPTSAAKVGTAVVTYGTSGNPGSLGDAKPTLPGSYVATFTVPESQNYKALTKDVAFTVAAATVQYVADDVSGTYSGAGYGIAATISVSAPATGAVVKYSESETGPWQDEPITYKDVCNAKPIYFQISATGYSTVTDSRTVTITPKTLTSDFVWLVLPTEDYVYDGAAKTPDAACGDGDPSIITANDFDVSYSDNVDAGTAKATFTGKGNYTGTVEEEFEILKADNEWTTEPAIAGWTYGQAASEPTSAAKVGTAVVTYGTSGNPGSLGDAKPTLPGSYVATFTVPESQNYKALTKDVAFTVAAATVQYVADDVSGTYSGAGYGIAATISVSAPASGATVKYSTAETGPWQDEPITYKDVCNAKPIFFQISATGYTTMTDSRTVTISCRPVTITSGDGNWTYDGQAHSNATVTVNGFVEGEGVVANNFATITDAGTVPNAFGYAFVDGTLASNYSVSCVTGTLAVAKATPGGGEEPGGGTVPEGGLSKFDATAVYDGEGHTIDTNALYAAFGAAIIGDFSCTYARAQDQSSVTPPAVGWEAETPVYTNAGEYVVWYRVSNPNYEDFVHAAKVTITPRDIANVTIAEIGDVVYEGTAIEPVPTVTDGNPSIITAEDYDVSYSGNNAPGQATVTLTGKRNYTGTVTANFTIANPTVSEAELSAEIAWKYLRTTGTFFAQLKVACTNGLEFGINELRFVFADRMGADGKRNAALWDTQSRSANQNMMTFDGVSCRYVPLDASLITEQGVDFIFGVSNLSGDSVPVPERTIELYSRKRVAPRAGNEASGDVEDFIGYLVWKSNGHEFFLPLLEGDAAEAMNDAISGELRGGVNAGTSGEVLFAAGGLPSANSVPYFGVLLDENGVVCGSVDVSLPKVGRRTKSRKAKVKIAPIGEKQISFTGIVDQDGFVEGIAAGRDIVFEIGVGGIEGVYGPWIIACARSRASGKDDIAHVVDRLNGKSYGVVIETMSSDTEGVCDFSEVCVKVGSRGKAKISCVLADGAKATAVSNVIVPNGGALCIPVVVKAYRGKKGGFGFLLWIDGDEVLVTALSALNTTGAKRPFILDWEVSDCSALPSGSRK